MGRAVDPVRGLAGRPWLGLTRFTFQPALLELAEVEGGHALVRVACALALLGMLGTIAAVLGGS
jgi:hypothetical protein